MLNKNFVENYFCLYVSKKIENALSKMCNQSKSNNKYPMKSNLIETET